MDDTTKMEPSKNPIYNAYSILYQAFTSNESVDGLMIAIEEAIGFLGEALDD